MRKIYAKPQTTEVKVAVENVILQASAATQKTTLGVASQNTLTIQSTGSID